MSNDEMSTKPTIETVLERINELGNRLSGEIQALRVEMEKGFHRLDNQINHLAGEWVRLRTDHEDLEQRVSRLEKEKA